MINKKLFWFGGHPWWCSRLLSKVCCMVLVRLRGPYECKNGGGGVSSMEGKHLNPSTVFPVLFLF